jgi:hypothetical protein
MTKILSVSEKPAGNLFASLCQSKPIEERSCDEMMWRRLASRCSVVRSTAAVNHEFFRILQYNTRTSTCLRLATYSEYDLCDILVQYLYKYPRTTVPGLHGSRILELPLYRYILESSVVLYSRLARWPQDSRTPGLQIWSSTSCIGQSTVLVPRNSYCRTSARSLVVRGILY